MIKDQLFCKDCKKPIDPPSGTYRCEKDQREFRKKYYQKYRKKFRINSGRCSQKNIDKDLKGGPVPGGLYTGCTPEQIEALQTGNVELLLKTTRAETKNESEKN
jgi:hypothetical protein